MNRYLNKCLQGELKLNDRIQEQFQILKELKAIDDQLRYLENDIQKIPTQIEKIQTELKSKEGEFLKYKSQVEDFEKRIRGHEADLKERDEKIKKSEGKLMEVKTNEEYQAANREILVQKEQSSKIEEGILELMSQLEIQKVSLKTAKGEFEEIQKNALGQIGTLEKEKAELEKEKAEKVKIRETNTTRLESNVALLYMKLTLHSHGAAIAEVNQGMCMACHMNIRPQIFNEILGFKAVHRCTHSTCGKILIPVTRVADKEASGC